jgi:hypothetical protein
MLYRYLFYQYYKIAKRTEQQWGPALRVPDFVANLTFSLTFYLFIFPLFLFSRKTFLFDSAGYITPLLSVGLFIFNYFFLIKTKRLYIDEINFDTINNRIAFVD